MTSLGCFVVHFLLLSSVSGLIMPMKKPSGETDMDSVINHVKVIEQSITGLQTQAQTKTVELTIVTAKLKTAEQAITGLQAQVQTGNTELATIKSQLQTAEQTIVTLQTSATELTTVKAKLQTTEDELTSVKAELKLAETDIAILKHDLQNLPDAADFNQLKTQFEALKASNAFVHQINFTVVDAVSADVKTNMGEIQSLKSELFKTETEVNKTSYALLITRAEVANLSEMSIMNAKLNLSIQDVVFNTIEIASLKSQLTDVNKSANTTSNKLSALETQLTSTEAEYKSLLSRQNITEHEVAECKALAQSTADDLKTVQIQVNTISTDVTALRSELMANNTKTNMDVAFQITQYGASTKGWTTLTFNTVDYNTGNGYNKTTGVFTTPTSGTYIFWASGVFYNPVGYHYIHIHQGSQTLATGACYMETSGHYCEVYPTVTSHLDVGDQVHFTTSSSSDYIAGYGFSSYGGALLHAS